MFIYVYMLEHNNHLSHPWQEAVGDKIELSKEENCNSEMQIYQNIPKHTNTTNQNHPKIYLEI